MTTFSLDQLCFFDTETRAETLGPDGDLKKAGTHRYFAAGAFTVINAYQMPGRDACGLLTLDHGFDGDQLMWKDAPIDLKLFYDDADAGRAWFAAFNAGFDRQAWSLGTYDYPPIRPDMIIDVKAQAAASNMPDDLEACSKFIGRGGKQADGKALIKLFAPADGGTPQTHPVEWYRYKSYGVQDVDELVAVFEATRQLPLEEWQEYWTSERINDRGMAIDLPFVERAARVAAIDQKRTNALLARFTNGQITTVNQHKRIADWVWDNLRWTEARDLMVTDFDDENEDDLVTCKISVKREIVIKLITFLEARDDLSERDKVMLEILRLREFGASAAPKKFDTMLRQHVGGALLGQYVFNGAGQTGRYSAKGVQVHNLTRDVLGKDGGDEIAAIERINELEIG